MNIIQINTVEYGSTGKIAIQIAEILKRKGHNAVICTSGGRSLSKNKINRILIGGFLTEKSHLLLGRITGFNGCFSVLATIQFVNKLKKIKPDVIHLHNLHNCFINLSILFRFIKKNNIKVVWTLHDCWSFTGHCPHFDMIGCDKWRTGCNNCPQYKSYPATFFDNSKIIYKLKQKWFKGVNNLTIVTPSHWLANLVKQSFLKDYPVKVINNGIDLSIFKPTDSDFRKKHNCEDKFILLGVAFGWGARKGLDVFVELSKRLDEHFQIVLVGTDENVDKQLPKNIISIHRTQNQKELAEMYTAADLFVNPTREDTFATVNIESLACGTPVLTFETGGCPETIDKSCGSVVPKNDIDAINNEIIRIYNDVPYLKEDCLKRVRKFDMNDRFEEYISYYE